MRISDTFHWCASMMRFSDEHQWCVSVMRISDAFQWCASMMRFSDAHQWCVSMMRIIDASSLKIKIYRTIYLFEKLHLNYIILPSFYTFFYFFHCICLMMLHLWCASLMRITNAHQWCGIFKNQNLRNDWINWNFCLIFYYS